MQKWAQFLVLVQRTLSVDLLPGGVRFQLLLRVFWSPDPVEWWQTLALLPVSAQLLSQTCRNMNLFAVLYWEDFPCQQNRPWAVLWYWNTPLPPLFWYLSRGAFSEDIKTKGEWKVTKNEYMRQEKDVYSTIWSVLILLYIYIKAPFRLTSSLRVHLSVSALRAALHLGTSLSW